MRYEIKPFSRWFNVIVHSDGEPGRIDHIAAAMQDLMSAELFTGILRALYNIGASGYVTPEAEIDWFGLRFANALFITTTEATKTRIRNECVDAYTAGIEQHRRTS